MKQFSFNDSMVLKLNAMGLTEQQKRLIKSVNMYMLEVLNTEEESKYFHFTNELMILVSAIVKQSHFQTFVKEDDLIPYAEQALESAFDNVRDKIYGSETDVFDN